GFERFIAAMESAAAAEADPFDSLLAFGRSYVRFAASNAGWFRLQFSRAWNEELARRAGVHQRLAPAQAARQRFLEKLAGVLPDGSGQAADLYRLVWGTAHGLATFVVERVFQLVHTDEERIAAADEALRILAASLRALREAARS
ncbi:MAG TPA: WHG domain-containing protein, partial [Kofleriaceae bacterium]|nr:WHG domain-containing protein [Kofleriaceae bacterium]